jgi:hypothetical protein
MVIDFQGSRLEGKVSSNRKSRHGGPRWEELKEVVREKPRKSDKNFN